MYSELPPKINKLTPISQRSIYVGGRSRVFVLVQCDCGSEPCELRKDFLLNRATSCGCDRYERWTISNGKRQTAEEVLLNKYQHSYIQGAKSRDMAFSLSRELFKNLVQLNCHYCGAEPSTVVRRSGALSDQYLRFSGIDRVDNSVGYIEENVVSCCGTCNYLKSDRTVSDFVSHSAKVAFHRSNHTCLKREPFYTDSYHYQFYRRYERGAIARDILWALNQAEFFEVAKQSCYYCGAAPSRYVIDYPTGRGIITSGVDRYFNDHGYTKENIVPACKECNLRKLFISGDEFINNSISVTKKQSLTIGSNVVK